MEQDWIPGQESYEYNQQEYLAPWYFAFSLKFLLEWIDVAKVMQIVVMLLHVEITVVILQVWLIIFFEEQVALYLVDCKHGELLMAYFSLEHVCVARLWELDYVQFFAES